MQRLLNLKSAGSGGIADAPPSPAAATARAPSPFARSLDVSLLEEASTAGSAPGTPTGSKAGRASRQSIWNKLGSGIKARRISPATAAARSSFEGAGAVELPMPSNASSASGLAAGGHGDSLAAGDDDASYDPHADTDAAGGAAGPSRSGSPCSSAVMAGGLSGGGYCDETLDLRHVGAGLG
jgi:hypothetical protein